MKQALLFIAIVFLCLCRTASAEGLPLQNDSSILTGAKVGSSKKVGSKLLRLPLVSEGSPWNSDDNFILSSSNFLLVDFGKEQTIAALLLQADNDDSYLVEYSVDRLNWRELWAAPVIKGYAGIRSRSYQLATAIKAKYLRVVPKMGDQRYAVARLLAFRELPAWWKEIPTTASTGSNFLHFLNEDRLNLLRPLVALLGIIGLLWAWLVRLGKLPQSSCKIAKFTLLLAGLFSFFCWWNFLSFHSSKYVHTWDFFHYYIGAKYLPELGYTGLYECTARADIEAGFSTPVKQSTIRDLKTNQIVLLESVLASGQCKDSFSNLRWNEFKKDTSWFRERMEWDRWIRMRKDHGFNGTPVWQLLGSAFTKILPLSDSTALLLAALDPILIITMWIFVIWAFGIETACAAAIYWGTNFPARFFWTGGSFLRHDWLCYAAISICLLKRNFSFTAGAFFAYAMLLRIFPGFILVGLLLQILSNCIKMRKLCFSVEQKRFGLGLITATVLLLIVAGVNSGQKDIYQKFIENSIKHLATPLTNNMGLINVLSFRSETRAELLSSERAIEPFAAWKAAHNKNKTEVRAFFLILVALYLVLFFFAARDLPLWAALCLGSTAIPILSELTCYYYSILLLIGLLWCRLPAAVVGLAVVAGLTSICSEFFAWSDIDYTAMSLVVVVYIYALLLLILWCAGRESNPRPED